MAKDLGGVVFNNYSAEVLNKFHDAILRALERCGEQAEGYAKDLAPVDTGNLRNSISHTVDEDEPAVYIGSNTSYAPYVELATGIYADGKLLAKRHEDGKIYIWCKSCHKEVELEVEPHEPDKSDSDRVQRV